ncbi:RcnB family protein [Burkholderia sp. BCC1977]|uniref:RcnB family protein n=1 Tax=Burkholderia sp. BCC1977 TaxID=2817440 RepID=UPI002ABD1520|nr:RcnB family protein [Burkholderia sp. BCC1977]
MKKQALACLITASMLATSIGAFAQQGPDDQQGGRAPGGNHELRQDHGPERDGGARAPGGPQMQAPHRDARQEGRGDVRPGEHGDWRRGERVPQDYRGAQYVVDDWRGRDLQPPPAGYHWLQINGDFVLAAIATGVIANVLLAPHH